ncbi:hypothetical protein GW916_09295 [bacterium]|nr:hypothetical protein [bacterium]
MLGKTAALTSAILLSTLGTLGCEVQPASQKQLQNPTALIAEGFRLLEEQSQRLFMSGEVVDFGRLKRDGKIDFALVTPSLTRMDLLSFDLSTLISPEFDQIQVVGYNLSIPSNISLPAQRENYSLFTISLDKPAYKSFVNASGDYTFSALRGQFPVKQVVDDFRSDKSIFEIMNHFSFLGSGKIDVQLTGSIQNQNISVNQVNFDQEATIVGPEITSEQLAFGVSVSDEAGKLSPVDLKNLKRGQSQVLRVAPYGKPLLLSALVNKGAEGEMPNFDQMSLTLIPMEEAASLDFLPMVETPVLNENVLTLYPPTLREGLLAQSVYISFSEVKTVGQGGVKTEEKTMIWENFYQGFPSFVEIPPLDFEKNPERSYQFEVLYLAKDLSIIQSAEVGSLEEITHISRNIVVLE